MIIHLKKTVSKESAAVLAAENKAAGVRRPCSARPPQRR